MTKLLVVDTETGGLNPDEFSILSLGAVVWHDDPRYAVDTFEVKIVEPKIVVEPEAMKVNRIDLEQHKKEGKNPLAAVSLFHNFIRQHWPDPEKVNLAGHCIDFDVGFMRRLFKQAGIPQEYPKLFTHRTLDTSGIGRYLVLCGRLELEPKSDALFDYFGIDLGESARHTALGDALATAMLLTRLVEFSKLKELKP